MANSSFYAENPTPEDLANLDALVAQATAEANSIVTDAHNSQQYALDAQSSAASANTSMLAAQAAQSAASTSASAAATSASSASASAASASASATSASGSASTASTALTNFQNQYQGAHSSDPATRPGGGALQAGDIYFSTTSNVLRFYSGSAWSNALTPIGYTPANVAGDTFTGVIKINAGVGVRVDLGDSNVGIEAHPWLVHATASNTAGPRDTYQYVDDNQLGIYDGHYGQVWNYNFGTSTFTATKLAGDGSQLTALATSQLTDGVKNIFSYLSAADIAGIKSGDGANRKTVLQAALDAIGQSVVYWPPGVYCSYPALVPSAAQTWIGGGHAFGAGSTRLTYPFGTTPSAPLVDINNIGGITIRGFTIQGSDPLAGSIAGQQLVRIIGTANNNTFDDIYFLNGYQHIYFTGTPFYQTISNCQFGPAYNRNIDCEGVGAAGVDLFIHHCRFLGATSSQDAVIWLNGLGSLIMSDSMVSVASPSVASLVFATQATNFGGAQLTNVVVESNTTAICIGINTIDTPWNNIHFVNCFGTGGSGPGLQVINGVRVKWIGGALASQSSSGVVFVPFNCINKYFVFDTVTFDYLGSAAAPILISAGGKISGDIISPLWGVGSTVATIPLFDASATAASNIEYLNTFGGYKGNTTSGSPAGIVLPSGTIAGTRY
jgi:hypothetical protein